MFATLRNRDFSLLWLGGLISLTGDWTLNIGLPIALYALTRSITVLSLSLLASLIPSALVGSLTGVLVDRWDRRRTLIVSNVLLGALLTPLLLVRSAGLVWIVFATLFVEACLEQFTRPTESALLPALVDAPRLASANGLISVAANVARLIGPALGGSIALLYGLNGVLFIDIGSFALAALLFTLIRAPHAQRPTAPADLPTPAHPLRYSLARSGRDWVSGLRVVLQERTLALIFVVFAVTSIGEGIFATLFVVFITVNAHGDARAFGGMMSAQAIGGLLGGAVVALLGHRLLSRWVIALSALLFGAIDLVIFNAPAYFPLLASTFAHTPWLPTVTLLVWLLVLFVVVGLPGAVMSNGLQTITQLRTPPGYLGRVFASLGAVMALFVALGTGLAAWLAPRFGVITVLNGQGAGYLAMGVLLAALLTRDATAAASLTLPDAASADSVGAAR